MIGELFGAEGWEPYLEGFAELGAIEREPGVAPVGMRMMA